jgi:hypothetical protein
LVNRFGTAIGKLRENAEKEVKKDEERMYKLRDLMSAECEKMGAMFDERTFDCVYTVNFFVGNNQQNPTASRKRYAGDTFVCMQEWFGTNATTAMENAARETRAQTAASSAMLGSGVGSAVGMVTSGAIDRAVKTQKAKKELKKECENQQGMVLKNGECVSEEDLCKGGVFKAGSCWCNGIIMPKNATCNKDENGKSKIKYGDKKGKDCTTQYQKAALATYDDEENCVLKSCVDGYKPVKMGDKSYCGVDQNSSVWNTEK